MTKWLAAARAGTGRGSVLFGAGDGVVGFGAERGETLWRSNGVSWAVRRGDDRGSDLLNLVLRGEGRGRVSSAWTRSFQQVAYHGR